MAAPTRGIVTPEAVLLEFQTASVPTRVLQFSLDFIIQALALVALLLVLAAGGAATGSIPTAIAVIFTVVSLFAVLIGYPVAMEALWNGRTVGMAAVGLRVVTKEGAPVRFRHCAIRGALGLIDFWLIPIGVVATISVLLTRDNQRLGDLAAGTLVLLERTAKGRTAQAVAFVPPYGHEQYAAALDVTTVTPEQYGVIRSYLLRVGDLSPSARWSLAVRLANPVASAMGHTPPATVTPEAFLVSVAAAYQLREGTAVGYGAPAPVLAAAPAPAYAGYPSAPPGPPVAPTAPPGWTAPPPGPPPAPPTPSAPPVSPDWSVPPAKPPSMPPRAPSPPVSSPPPGAPPPSGDEPGDSGGFAPPS